ncbi:MAG: glycoside hydrolase family 127 protein [Bacteroidales bacterium]|nr:glycoside hydrolase family 127 protein [Bacteroidales bacterium]
MKPSLNVIFVLGICNLLLIGSCTGKKATENAYPIEPVPFTSVHFTDQFWAPRLITNHEVTIPIAIEQSMLTGRIKNFEIAGGLKEGEFCSTYPFDDSDIYKIIEAAAYSLQSRPDPVLESRIDSLIYLIGQAQEEDGYLFTYRTIMGDNSHPWIGTRWEKVNELSHELYNLGHLYEAATAYFRATGKKELLDISVKSADLIADTFGWGKIEDYPGHQEIEIGLVKLFQVTGDKKYLDLAKFFLDIRGPGGEEYNQAHKKVVDQTEGVGHSVRATYMYAGMADIAALYRDESYIHAIRAIWEDIVHKKTYVTGGIGASGGNEGFGESYHLPNMSAYCETCASVGNIIWNYRMFLYDGDARYMDVLERTLYNAFLSGVSLTGDRFFYPNPLESYGQHERSKWFGCACCPPNLARTLPSLPGYVYAKTGTDIYINLFVDNTAHIDFRGTPVQIIQETDFPWEGNVGIIINPERKLKFNLRIRIPGWAREQAIPGDLYTFATPVGEPSLSVNGKTVQPKMENGYAIIRKTWKQGDTVKIEFPMDIRLLTADERVRDNREKVAVQWGPMVYCAEWPDTRDGHVLNLVFDREAAINTSFRPDLLNGVRVIGMQAAPAERTLSGEVLLKDPVEVTLIPYYAWNNRGAGEMMVWLPLSTGSVRPLPAPTIASRSRVSSDRMTKALIALNDQNEPKNSNDHTWPYFHWWPENNAWVWVQYDFEKPETVSGMRVYWFDDGPFGGCRIPETYELQYKKGSSWVPVTATSEYTITKDDWDELSFKPVTTNALRLRVRLPEEFSSGIHEWTVN